MSAQHTPGPWIVHPLKSPYAYVIPVEHASRPVGGHTDPEIDLATYAQEICSVSCPDRHRSAGEMRANARLISVAPELLAILEEIVSRFGCNCAQPDCRTTRALAVIAKAKGEAS